MPLSHGPRRGELLNQISNELWNLANSHYRAQTVPDIHTIRTLVLIIIPATPAEYGLVAHAMICTVSLVFMLSYPPTHLLIVLSPFHWFHLYPIGGKGKVFYT